MRRFGREAATDGAWRYERICAGIASDPELLALIDHAPPAQRRANILLAAVHYLLLEGAEGDLARHYPTVLAWRGEPDENPSADPFPDFSAFCRRHHQGVADLVATRATQTNEVGRCAALLPALATVAGGVRRPLAIVDLGCSAGLNLLFDRFGYDYGPKGCAGASGSAVTIRCQVRSGTPPLAVPAVVARIGVDQAPVDVADDGAARWLLACQWPDHLDRFSTLRAAIELARDDPDRPRLVTGDVCADLTRAVAALPDDAEAHLCVVHSWTAAYLGHDGQSDLAAALARLAEIRPWAWVFAEQPAEVPGLPVPPPPPGRGVPGATALVLVTGDGRGSAPSAWRLADMHSHGRWLQWYGRGEPARARATGHRL